MTRQSRRPQPVKPSRRTMIKEENCPVKGEISNEEKTIKAKKKSPLKGRAKRRIGETGDVGQN